jgi:outer membrane protein insertion porin family
VSITYVIREGVPHTVNRIVITGNKNTRDKVIRREMILHEGNLFNSELLRRSQQKIFNLGLFEDISIEMLEGPEPETVDVVFNVEERYSIGSFNFGGGWDTVDAWTVSGGVSAQNLFGLAHTLDLSTTIGSTSTLFNVDYSMPRVFDSPYTLGFDAYKLEREYSTYSKKSYGGGVRFGRKITQNVMLFVKYRYEHINIFDVDEDASIRFKESEGESDTSSFTTMLRRSTINNVLLPTKGMRTELQAEVAGGYLGADNNFYKISLNNNIYFPLYNDIALRLRGEYGFVKEYGDSEDVPIFERFYGGGATTIRGYKDRSIGPHDENEDAIGGSSRVLLSSEIIIPIQKQIRLLTFFDMGDVYGADEDLDPSSWRKSVGVGLRLNTPFGLMRFDLGYKLDDAEVEDDDKDYEFHFGLGNIF